MSSLHLPRLASAQQVRHRSTPVSPAAESTVRSDPIAGETACAGQVFAARGKHLAPTPAEGVAAEPSTSGVIPRCRRVIAQVPGDESRAMGRPAARHRRRAGAANARSGGFFFSPPHFAIPTIWQDGGARRFAVRLCFGLTQPGTDHWGTRRHETGRRFRAHPCGAVRGRP